ncbi:serine hydrolase domain-containing protein [Muricoccus radiodurans]|uniref:serine hydrolase domain-containing protein n=1 Tax=Muricoccus radiodurans TaxID=2231721 RepID=UPI003CEE6213
MTAPDFSAGTAEAAAIARAWTDAGGPGGAIVLFDGDGPRGAASGGLASIEHGVSFTPDTPSRWASISKQFAAATLLLSGFDLETPLGKLVADLPDAIAAVPLGRALDMTGAIPDLMETLVLLGVPYTTSLSPAQLFSLIKRLPGTGGPPGREMAYSNTGWRLTEAIFGTPAPDAFDDPAKPRAAKRSHRSDPNYEAALRRLVLSPLGLDAVAFPVDETAVVPKLATPYWRHAGGWRRGRYGLNYSPSGGLAGSATDLARWGAALLGGRGPMDGMLARLSALRLFENGTPSFYRLGLSTLMLGDLFLAGHGGSLPGNKTHILMAPALGCGVALISNQEETDALPLALRVMAALTGRSLPRPASLPPGLYASADSEAWAEVEGETITFMGVTDRLYAAEDGGARTLPAYLEASLRPTADGALEGIVGGVRHRLLPVPKDTALDPALVGGWHNRAFGVSLEVRAPGVAEFPGIFPRDVSTLLPLPGGRAIGQRQHGPWGSRPLLWRQPDDTLRLVAHRSRVLTFERA